MAGSRILVIEDSDAIRVPVLTALHAQGFQVEGDADGSRLEERLNAFGPELVVLDVMLPGRDGFTLLDVVRAQSDAGVLMLTARDATADRVRGLSSGADDYLVKPFQMAELVARVRAVLRRTGAAGVSTAVGDLVIGDDAAVVRRGDAEIDLTATERRILAYLATRPGRVVSKTQILTHVWGYDGFDPNVVEVHVSSLRRKLEQHGPRLVHTVRSRGYRLSEPS
ncbi:DNA-binding response OmpR family regulator [Friedmanniella endophytica]|uniref:DNA-binding response OmpR family regulator n=1 Tax=Microlunatus kandeliicorticis TaxID=1759536 RepID=A0A7W3IQP5_9ACTN|nr:response regulator transcription factor [Microlunatus kandeliicorticis]MBA8793473.1 DNA-binding response OmpR family regulator [Microlunatus kandeliicorticis]